MEWSEVINNPLLQNLPFKIELNRWGKILMSPASNRHGILQFEVGTLINQAKRSGKIIIECSIQTPQGVKVADVAWASDAFMARYGVDTPYPAAPEICVEVISPSNAQREMEEKIALYLDQGAKEVWLCNQEGQMRYYDYSGRLDQSAELR